MREIKFRAWDAHDEKIMQISSFECTADGAIVNAYAYKKYAIGQPKYYKDLDDLILMQYTGLKDKNGKEIYEGDILRALMTEPDFGAVYHDVGEVVYHPEAAQFVMQKGKIVARISNNVEIIGNIYQNPELLNK